MTLIPLKKPPPDSASAMEVLDDLRKQVESGQIIAFAVVGIEPDDTTMSWLSSTQTVTRLRMMGALQSLVTWYNNGGE